MRFSMWKLVTDIVLLSRIVPVLLALVCGLEILCWRFGQGIGILGIAGTSVVKAKVWKSLVLVPFCLWVVLACYLQVFESTYNWFFCLLMQY